MRGETAQNGGTAAGRGISIHSPHARGDWPGWRARPGRRGFQSTPLMRGETIDELRLSAAGLFQSTPLMRGETKAAMLSQAQAAFQSTPLMRGETPLVVGSCASFAISIHSPHARGDQARPRTPCGTCNFNPLPSCEGRLYPIWIYLSRIISIHSPHARGDESFLILSFSFVISIHSPHARGDHSALLL